MKQFYFLIAAFIVGNIVNAQCPPAGVNFTSQTQLNNFITQYPNCTEIDGDVFIGGNITSLEPLANIVTITGALEIREVSNLENLDGLENLETVGTDLILREVDDLENINALSSLTSVGGEFTVRSCPELVSLDGIENLATVGLGLIIRDCESLLSIEGLTGVTFVGEILEVVENPLLTSLSGLENIETVVGGEEGALVIEGNDSLTSLEGFGSANTVMTGGVTISTNGDLSYCSVPAICNFLQNPPQGALIEIGLNVTGCDSEAEVLAACAPVEAPTIANFTPNSGCAGTSIVITGTGFSSVTDVSIGGTPVTDYIVNSTTQITAIIGAGTTGTVTVTNTTDTATSTETFTITPSPEAPTGNATQVIAVNPGIDATIEDITITLEEDGIVTWYTSEEDALTGENALAPGTVLISGNTYYATQTVGECVSIDLFEVAVEVILGTESFKPGNFSYYPVPVKDVLTISHIQNIAAITVFNVLGQEVVSTQPNTTEVQLNMTELSKGVYVIRISADDAVKIIRVVKE